MLASEQLKSVDIGDVRQTEYKIIDLESDTKYIVYLRAVTVAPGEKTFVEDSTTVLGGLLLPLSHGVFTRSSKRPANLQQMYSKYTC